MPKDGLLRKIEDYPANSIASEPGDVEIHEQPDMAPGESQIRQQLREVYALQFLDRLDLHDDSVLDQKIQSISVVQQLRLVSERQQLLPFDPEATLQEFQGEAALVRSFEHSRPELSMHLDCGPDDRLRKKVQIVRHGPRGLQFP